LVIVKNITISAFKDKNMTTYNLSFEIEIEEGKDPFDNHELNQLIIDLYVKPYCKHWEMQRVEVK
jgi:hypothetical protein